MARDEGQAFERAFSVLILASEICQRQPQSINHGDKHNWTNLAAKIRMKIHGCSSYASHMSRLMQLLQSNRNEACRVLYLFSVFNNNNQE